MTDERLLHTTTSLCRSCKEAVPASVVALGTEVWMKKSCDEHGAQEVRLSTSVEWYEQTREVKQRFAPPRVFKKDVVDGCPFDCGPCTAHTQKVRLPVVTITSACNLDCPICYVHNKNDDAYHMPVEDFALVLEHLRTDHGAELDIINLTGGEPTLHPRLFDMLDLAAQQGIHRVTVCSNGIKLAKDEAFVERLGTYNARIALSFDTFDPHTDQVMQGAQMLALKLEALRLCEKHGVDVTLIPVMTRGLNEHEIGKIIDFGMNSSAVRHLEVHTMTFTGQSGTTFQRAEQRSGRISMYEVLEEIEKHTSGLLRPSDFVTSPCAHPLCYQIAYLLVDPDGGAPIPFTRFLPASELYDALSDRLYLEPSPRLEESLRGAIDRLWAEAPEDDAEAQRTLRLLRALVDTMSLPREESLRAGEKAIKAVYVHSHMDEETFDVERTVDCCDSNCYADGTTIPVCNYNVLYREKEAKFNVEPARWGTRSGGQRVFSLPVLR